MSADQEAAHKVGVGVMQAAEAHTRGPKASANHEAVNSQSNLRAVSVDTNRGAGSPHVTADNKLIEAMDSGRSYYVTRREAAHVRDVVRNLPDTGAGDTVFRAANQAVDHNGHKVIDARKNWKK